MNHIQVIDCSRLSSIKNMVSGFSQPRNTGARKVTTIGTFFTTVFFSTKRISVLLFYNQLGFSWSISSPTTRNCLCSSRSLWLSTSICCSCLESLRSAKKKMIPLIAILLKLIGIIKLCRCKLTDSNI